MININSSRSFTSEISWDNLNDQIKKIPDGDYYAIIDENARWFFNRKIKDHLNCKEHIIKAVEINKSQKAADRLIKFLLNNRAGRDAVLVAVGGGITSDLAGYTASIYKRGIRWISIPTTLLSQVDASVGGKTAINSKFGKNIIGSFHPPIKVIMSHEPSQSWSEEIWLEGLAEVVKIFLVFDLKMLEPLIKQGINAYCDEMTKRSVELKATVVQIDPWENNLRAALNYGHTFGHAIEHVSGIRHGIAVSMGLRIANRVAEKMGIMTTHKADEIDIILNKLDFPQLTNLPKFNKILPYIQQDKKNIGTDIKMILIDGVRDLPMLPENPAVKVPVNILEEGYSVALANNR